MRRRRDPVAREDLTRSGVSDVRSYVELTDDPETGGWTRLLIRPAGYVGGGGRIKQFEYHTPQEEIILVSGTLGFDEYYRAEAPAYLNHPPTWLHPTEIHFTPDAETVMLIRLSKPIDTFYAPIPEGWDGREYFAEPSNAPRGKAISALQLSEVRYGPVLRNGIATGEEAGVLWENPVDDVVTWLWRIPPGWRGSGSPSVINGSDEVYVLEGDLTTVHGEREVSLRAGSYYCYPDVLYDGGDRASSASGLLAVRWSRRVPEIGLPPIGHDRTVE